MTGNVIITLIIFGTLFGIIYIIIASRTRIRMALIEKGADASIFNTQSTPGGNVFSIVLVNLALLLFAIGIGIFLAAVLNRNFGVVEEIAFPGTIFTVAGLALFVGYKISSNIGKNRNTELRNGS